jgi:hypothetical protein
MPTNNHLCIREIHSKEVEGEEKTKKRTKVEGDDEGTKRNKNIA